MLSKVKNVFIVIFRFMEEVQTKRAEAIVARYS